MLRTTIVAVLAAVGAVSLAATADATQVMYLSPRQLGEQSELVVQGRVIDVRSYWNDQRTKVFTTTRIAVDETYKGRRSGTVDLVQLGGVVGNVKVTVHGALQWREGEEVLLFLESPGGGMYQVSGFSQGKFNVKRNPATGEAFISRPELAGTELLGAPSVEASSRVDDVPVGRFVNQALGRR
jgi:hypothetical protein